MKDKNEDEKKDGGGEENKSDSEMNEWTTTGRERESGPLPDQLFFSAKKKTHWKDHPIKTSGGSVEDRIEFDGSHRFFLS